MKDSLVFDNSFMKTHATLLLTALAAIALAPVTKADDKVDFEKQIFPIFKAKCFKCHEKEHEDNGKIKKPKGGLRLDNAECIKKGGKEDKENCLVPGKAAGSTIYTATTLPSTDDKAMPPDGKGDPLTKDEQELLKKWIDGGASFGTWKGVD